MESIENNRWQRFRDLFVVFAITISMNGLYAFLLYSTDENAAFIQVITCYPDETEEDCRKRYPPKPDISLSFYFGYFRIVKQIEFWSLLLSCFTIPVAIYFSATNNSLKFPIRLFATAENFNRLLISLAMTAYQMPNDWLPFSILDNFSNFISDANLYVQQCDFFKLCQYCQLLISISRFFAVSLDGVYFRKVHKWPFAQLILPYIVTFARYYIKVSLPDGWKIIISQSHTELFLSNIPIFLMFALDLVTNWNLRKLRKSGKASRVENLLMAQMISTSLLNIFVTIICQLNQLIASLLFGGNMWMMSLYTTGTAEAFAFQFVGSFLNALFLRKPKVNRKNAVTLVTKSASRDSKQSQATNNTVSH